MAGPFHDDVGSDAHGEGIDDEGAATGVGADEFPLGLEVTIAGAKTSGDNSRSRDSIMSMKREATPFAEAKDRKSLSASFTLSMYFEGFLMSFWAAKASRSAVVISSNLPRTENIIV